MTNAVHTIYGTLDDKQLKALKGYIDEIVMLLTRNKSQNESIKDIIGIANDELKIPKKIVKRMATTQFKQSLQTEVAEFKEFEALIEAITEVK
jgi:hypothetical protein